MEKEKMTKTRQVRAVPMELRTKREDGEAPIIEGYFAVFNSNYDIGFGMSESVAPGAFSQSLRENDVRALVNHDSTLVLGRTSSKTLELHEDDKGLYGRIEINPNDRAAMDLYARVERGDVDGCSFGFDIRDEETEFLENGDVHWTLKNVDLGEVSCCTFPAYEATNIEARSKERDDLKKRSMEAWRTKVMQKLKKEVE